MSAVKKWYEVMKSNDMDKLDELLAEDVVFYSPVVYTPQKGKDITKMYLMAAGGVFGEGAKDEASDSNKSQSNFKYIKEIIGKKSALLEFESEMDGIYVNGVDVISWNEEGKIIEFKVFIRPLKGIETIQNLMGKIIKKNN